MSSLTIKDLKVEVSGKEVLKGLNLTVGHETVAIMGPNGSGKSTLAHTLAGHPNYKVTNGEILCGDTNLLNMSIEERALNGLFMGFQYPVEIPGVNNMYFMKAMVNAQRKHKGYTPYDAVEFMEFIKAQANLVGIDDQLLYRAVNEGFSGGEKKRNEVLQYLVLEPVISIFDEIDSGLDIDAMKEVAFGINSLNVLSSIHIKILITHYPRILEYVHPDSVHILVDGRIVKSGDKSLAEKIGRDGYAWLG
ncbi:hypothetical protein LCGC14_1448840 [marine sediment metagenome]|uniref:ABC transporter domain-containing protein n=1 Tax=marine sediment metagenome TaxID=412755 RepID=A0A0F9JJ46_9ZZZZ